MDTRRASTQSIVLLPTTVSQTPRPEVVPVRRGITLPSRPPSRRGAAWRIRGEHGPTVLPLLTADPRQTATNEPDYPDQHTPEITANQAQTESARDNQSVGIIRTRSGHLRSLHPLGRNQHHDPTPRPRRTCQTPDPTPTQHARIEALSNTHSGNSIRSGDERPGQRLG